MKNLILACSLVLIMVFPSLAQKLTSTEQQNREIKTLIGNYTKARDVQDPDLLASILTDDIDQLVSSGIWRKGKTESMEGMMRSSQNNSGKRTITVESVRLLTADCAVADARYEIQNEDGTARKMWSTFVVVQHKGSWKISAIRNMLPASSL